MVHQARPALLMARPLSTRRAALGRHPHAPLPGSNQAHVTERLGQGRIICCAAGQGLQAGERGSMQKGEGGNAGKAGLQGWSGEEKTQGA